MPARSRDESRPCEFAASCGEGLSVDDLMEAMGTDGISKSQVSRLCAEINDKVKASLAGPIRAMAVLVD
ncbi:hypothetical protein SAMN05216337_101096 [Bradyrhizobium brasilense]|uniref:Uncharacterized protein n=1 Tax=Bradyrhizobium brasilense TaxID=1419277 RepID=A0A1G6U283_9BRAD|nr:hypothetical protein SAMN05216337_101096 [Bradyrhizobium brasilense]